MDSKEYYESVLNQDYMFDGSAGSYKYANKRRNPNAMLRDLDDCEQIIIHCTASGKADWESPEAEIRYATNPNHINRSIGCHTASYHFYLNQKGDVFQLVSMKYKTSNCTGQNYNSVAVCINHDGFSPSEITDKMYKNLIDTICYIADKLDWGYEEEGISERIHFHRDYANKACPGKLIKQNVIDNVVERLKTWGDTI